MTTPFGNEINGFKIVTNWDGRGPLLDVANVPRSFDEWKKTEVVESWTSSVNGTITSEGV